MFGYIKINKPQLRICEFETYKAVYCGLCRQLGKKYGLWARFTLNYDFTFLALLSTALSSKTPMIEKARCPFNPLKKINSCHSNKEIEFSADVAVLMLYYKIIDNTTDEKAIKKYLYKFLKFALKNIYKKASLAQPEIDELMKKYISSQQKLEKEECKSTDEAAHPTADMLGSIFKGLTAEPTEEQALYRMGYFLGKYIYLCDAIDDAEKDIESGSYNVLNLQNVADLEHKYDIARSSVYMSIAEAQNAFNLIKLYHFEPILENIMFLGLKDSVNLIFIKKHKDVK